MATIHKMTELERRANDFALKKHPYSPFCEEYAKMYIEIATEQKAIDIDKACEWIEERKHPVLASDTDDTIVGYCISVEEFIEWLKSMEE